MVAGFITGGLARLAVPGPDPMPIWLTVAIGLAGSWGGGNRGADLGLGWDVWRVDLRVHRRDPASHRVPPLLPGATSDRAGRDEVPGARHRPGAVSRTSCARGA